MTEIFQEVILVEILCFGDASAPSVTFSGLTRHYIIDLLISTYAMVIFKYEISLPTSHLGEFFQKRMLTQHI